MERIRRSIAAKILLYILIVLCSFVAAVSGAVIFINVGMSHGDYYIGNDYRETKNEFISAKLFDDMQANFYNTEGVLEYMNDASLYGNSKKAALRKVLKENLEKTELITGESDASGWGYIIYLNEKGKGESKNDKYILKTVNPKLMKDYDSEALFIHSFGVDVADMSPCFEIEIYLSEREHIYLPPDISSDIAVMDMAYDARYVSIVAFIISLIIVILTMAVLIKAAGSREGSRWQRAIPLDLVAAVALFIIFALFDLVFMMDSSLSVLFIFAAAVVITVITFILIAALRIKQGLWWKSTIIYKLYKICKKILIKIGKLLVKGAKKFYYTMYKIPQIWKTALIFCVGLLINLMIVILAVSYSYDPILAIFLWIVGAVITGIFVFGTTFKMKRLKDGAEHIAAGELDYRIDEAGMYFDLKSHAETLNRIGEGLSLNVEEKLKSERMKTELITNVSHDIKTPLTSIINYIDFLKNEDIENDKAVEYIEVIDRQSQRLKKLTEDLVEVSKAATGNVNIELGLCDAGVMMNQIMGDYKEKAEAAGLEVVTKIPEQSVSIMADGRRLWRVLDNIMNNICKYSQSGTRVYQSLEVKNGKAVMTYKNISAYELNISSEELTERFVRGDRARHTEGSGLGLSIAKNLTELQGGIFEIDIDGDLFKVIISFDIA